jgi:hypothetical protein
LPFLSESAKLNRSNQFLDKKQLNKNSIVKENLSVIIPLFSVFIQKIGSTGSNQSYDLAAPKKITKWSNSS